MPGPGDHKEEDGLGRLDWSSKALIVIRLGMVTRSVVHLTWLGTNMSLH